MKSRLALSLGIAGGLIAMGCQSDSSTGPTDVPSPSFARKTAGAGSGPVEADYYLVEFRGSVANLQAVVEKAGGSLMRAHPEIGVATVGDLDDAEASALRRRRGVTRVTRDLMVQWIPTDEELNLQVREADIPTAQGHFADPTAAFFFPCQWNMTQANCPAAWAADYGGDPNVKVAVLDSGVDPFHSDLVGRIDVGQSASMLSPGSSPCNEFLSLPDEETIFDFAFHGTFVTGIITSNGLGTAGVAPNTQVVAVKVINCGGSGSFGDVIAGIIYATSLADVHIINMSLGAYFPKNAVGGGPLVAALNKAVNHAGSKGKLVVSAAGNEGAGPGVGADLDHDGNFASVPAQSGSGISAWAGDIDGGLAVYSNHGRSGAWVGAGGGDFKGSSQIPLAGCLLNPLGQEGIASVCSQFSIFFSCGPTSVLFGGTGTSFSAPMVAGVAALVDGKAGGSLSGGQLKTILARTADDVGPNGVDNLFSHGRVNAGNAVIY